MYSKLQFYYQTPKGPPTTFGWLTAVGIYHGNVDTTSPPGQDSVVAQSKMLKYPVQEEGVNPVPLSFVLTQFHALLLYPDKLVAMCLLNEELTGKLVGICKDIVRNFVWVYSERSIFKYKVYQEDRNMWRVYMEKGDFEKAQEFCRENLVHKDQVLIRKAETLFQNEKYQDSAETYSETQSSFEEVALKFLQIEQIEALKTFLCRKLEKLKPQDKTQITMIVVWVTELFLNQLGQIRDAGRESTLEYRELQEQFSDFMQARLVQDCMRNNCGTIYNLMSSHGDKENLTKFTLMNQDYERVIGHHIQKNNHLEALVILKQQGRKELFYQFAPSLMQAVPRQTVQALIEQGRCLAPSRLIPALIMSDQGENDAQASEVIRYLEFCIHKLGCQDQAIHNYILALYARLNPDKLMEYLSSQGNDISMINYDVHYALGLCRERNLTEACVQLSALLGLWEAAVDLALLVDVELAKQTAALPQNDLELRKKLWLKIAQHVVEEKDDIQQAMKFLQQCDLIKIEDILPFFSDFVTIDHFKDAICNSLQEYNRHIQDLKEEMEEATKSAEIIREEIQTFRNRYAFVSSHDNCNLCKKQLLARAFFLFPCSHRFHMDCLQTQVTPLLSTSQLSRVKDLQVHSALLEARNFLTALFLQRQLASMTVKEDTVSLGSSALTAREQVRSELDSIVAGECLYCGENMIRSIDKPFINEDEFDKILKDWQ
ncbi:hypothetical protein B566_EDAN015331 [Ephemera danica]|nr:hypothetical protein B566_EDAN015331 [Ephemera danica]